MRFTFSFILLSLVIISSCSLFKDVPNKTKAIDQAKVLRSFKSVADMNDSYFLIKDNNYFDFYRQLFDSVKNTRYPGKYIQKSDTIYLNFFDKKGEALLGTKAIIKGEDILFFK